MEEREKYRAEMEARMPSIDQTLHEIESQKEKNSEKRRVSI
jgi:hypothetical protein